MSVPTSLDRYRPHLNEAFTLHCEGHPSVELTLTAANPKIDDDVQCCFSLLFLGPDELLPQSLYRLEHPVLGELTLFLVPVQKKKSGIVYEAVFNLLKEESE